MLLVKTTLGPSQIHGVGLIAAEPILRGQHVAVFMPDFDRVFSVGSLVGVVADFVRHYGYLEGAVGQWCLNSDNMRFCNHSVDANTATSRDSVVDVAVRDIAVGEEITVNYFDFDDDAGRKLGGV